MKRVLLIGGSGQLGTAIREQWTDCEIVAPTHAELPLEGSQQLRAAIEGLRPDVVVNAAAFHEVDRCEAEPERAFEINAIALLRAARLARDSGAALVTIGTDYVFDGRASSPYAENDTPHPLSVYGASKLAGEYLVETLGARAFVVRTCGLYGAASHRRSFIERVLSQDPTAPPARVVADVVASPTFAGDLAKALRQLVDTAAYGLYHAVNTGPVSWYDFASEAIRQAGATVRVTPISAQERTAPAMRPRFSALANAKLRELGIAMPPWPAGIAAYLTSRLR